MTVGIRLKAARKQQGLTQAELSRISGVKQGTISAIETEVLKKSTFIVALADAMGVDPIWLNTGVERQKQAKELTAMEQDILRLLKSLDDDELRREIAYLQKVAQKHI
jgi:transcriptional regulator with XRE-family HTH domain|tara:strand:+ start:473 stop:796 length:324 start_codon:yes stop_codon:yes gene_type:complete